MPLSFPQPIKIHDFDSFIKIKQENKESHKAKQSKGQGKLPNEPRKDALAPWEGPQEALYKWMPSFLEIS